MTVLTSGHVLGERFRLIRSLGQGGMGEVWLVEDLELSDRVVAKIVPRDATEDEIALLRRECRHARRLVHSNIAPVYDFHRIEELCFITMAHVDGRSIGSLRGSAVEEILLHLVAVADALAYAHRHGIVHRDLKASNVLLDDDSGEPRLLDFGIAGALTEESGDVSVRGGGSEGFASPQQLAGAKPSAADDIYAFGFLARDLLSGHRLPTKLDALLNATTNRDPENRPSSMSEIKQALENVRAELGAEAAKPVQLTPPPRVERVTPVRPARADSEPFPSSLRAAAPSRGGPAPASLLSAAASRRGPAPASLLSAAASRRGIGAKTTLAFAFLLILAIGVFLVLPRWVEESGSFVVPPKTAEPTRGEAEASVPAEAREEAPEEEGAERPPVENVDHLEDLAIAKSRDNLEDLAVARSRAEDVLERVTELRGSLDARGAGLWGGTAYREAVDAIVSGDGQMGRRAFAGAESSYREALRGLETVRDQARGVASEAIRRGQQALATGSASEAEDAFNLALRIQPESAEAKRGLARASVVDELRRLVAEGEDLERRGELEGAAERYRKAVALDALSQSAQSGLARIDARASEEAFKTAMSEAVAALNRNDFAIAREGFERARAIRPDAADAVEGLKAVEEGARLEAIRQHREKAAAFEHQEAWRSAEEQYQAVLDLDGTIRFAQEGKARTEARARLSEKLDFHVANPARLSEDRVLEEASRALDAAKAVPTAGPKLEGQIARLTNLIDEFTTPVQVYLLSDNETEVVVYKVGTIGRFQKHELVLRPGTYTVVGRRQGYRDVRHRLIVQADEPPEPLVVRCVEEI